MEKRKVNPTKIADRKEPHIIVAKSKDRIAIYTYVNALETEQRLFITKEEAKELKKLL